MNENSEITLTGELAVLVDLSRSSSDDVIKWRVRRIRQHECKLASPLFAVSGIGSPTANNIPVHIAVK